MLRDYIKSEFYKFFRSKIVLVVLLILLILRLDSLKYYFLETHREETLYRFYQTSGGRMHIVFCLIGVLIGTRDYTTGFMKNLYAGSNKFYYATAKLVMLLTISFAWLVVEFSLTTLCVMCFGSGEICLKSEVGEMLFLCVLMPWLFWSATSVWWAGISSLLKNGTIALVSTILWVLVLFPHLYDTVLYNYLNKNYPEEARQILINMCFYLPVKMENAFALFQQGFKWDKITIWIIAMVVYIIGGFGMIWAGAKLRRKK